MKTGVRNPVHQAMLLVLLLFAGCLDEIFTDLPVDVSERKVIEGFAERDRDNYIFWANASITQDISSDERPIKLPVQFWIIYNDANRIKLVAGKSQRIPIEKFHQQYGGDPEGASFRLETLIGDDSYISEEQSIMQLPATDSFSVEIESRQEINEAGNFITKEYLKVLTHGQLLNELNQRTSQQWQVTATYAFKEQARTKDQFYWPRTCYVPYNIFNNRINIANSQDFAGSDQLAGLPIAEAVNDFRFSIGCYFTVVQKSLNLSSIQYWAEAKASNERSGTIFDVYPGEISTNIRKVGDPNEEVSGFFHASAIDTLRYLVTARDADFPTRFCIQWEEPCPPFDPDHIFDPCYDCLDLSFGARTTKPSYWEQ